MGTDDASDKTQHRAICATVGHTAAALSLDGLRCVDLIAELVRRDELEHGPLGLGTSTPADATLRAGRAARRARSGREQLRREAAAELAASATLAPVTASLSR